MRLDRHRPVRSRLLIVASFLALFAAGGCERTRPATRAGEALDQAGSRTGAAIGEAARATGGALERAGTWVRERTD
jgi:hypothetical protein